MPDTAWATLWTLARHQRRWSYVRLALEAGISERTAYAALLTGRCSAQTALRLSRALGLTLTQAPLCRDDHVS